MLSQWLSLTSYKFSLLIFCANATLNLNKRYSYWETLYNLLESVQKYV